ncbi:cell division protein PerM [Microbacterium sp. CJ88]|uniref:cell division protein PerM n=1 Tax=Microbacterium sp. CJ88 TaxID=3445672 RepID=UPI003F65E7D5
MNRLLVALLSVFDAVIAAAVGVAVALAPLTFVFVLVFGGAADWGALWPAGAAVWQFGHLVPQTITLPDAYLAATGIGADAASFVLSLAPLAFVVFTAVFAARSGMRAARADAWGTGVTTSSLVFAALAAGIALTSGSAIAQAPLWQAILVPALVFAVPALAGAVAVEWQEAGSGVVARVRDRLEGARGGWGDVTGLAVRGAAVALAALVGFAALGVAVALVASGGQVIALYQAAHVDVLGAVLVTIGQLAYLPTVIVWAMSFLAGPGFALGVGTAVSPAGTQLGVVPGIPILGIVPASSSWMLLLALLPVAAGALAGWVARSRLLAPAPPDEDAPSAVRTPWATAALDGLIGPPPGDRDAFEDDAPEPVGPRVVLVVLIAVLSAAGAALLTALASGSLGPGRLAEVGPQPGPVALAVGLEVLLGAGILLLAPRRRADDRDDDRVEPSSGTPARARIDAIPFASAVSAIPFADGHHDDAPPSGTAKRTDASTRTGGAPSRDPEPVPHAGPADDTAPLPPLPTPDPDAVPDGPAPRRPTALPPVD